MQFILPERSDVMALNECRIERETSLMSNRASGAVAVPVEGATMQTTMVAQRRLAFACSGWGSPTVVLETGLGADSAEWASVERGVASFARVYRYDRAGRGGSDRAPTHRDAYGIVDELHELLCAADVSGPYVLVGQSFGGLLMRVFAKRYRAEVAGLVLVDSMHEDQFAVLGPAFPPETPSDPPALADVRRFWTSGWKRTDSTIERIDFIAAIRQGLDVTSLDELPLHVITAGSYLHLPLPSASYGAKLQELWEGLQARFLLLSSRSSQTFARASGHFVQRDDPFTVVEAVRDVHQRALAAMGTI